MKNKILKHQKEIELNLQRFADDMAGMSTYGTKLSYKKGATYTEVAGVKSVPAFGSTPEQLDVTDLSMPKRSYIPGIEDVENLEFAGVYRGNNFRDLKEVCNTNETVEWKITYFDGTGYTFAGQGFLGMGGGEVNAAYDFALTIIVSDGPDHFDADPTP